VGTVIAMLHAGVRCAVPAQQVILAEAVLTPDPDVGLWADSSPEGTTPASHRVRLSTRSGAQWLGCAYPRLVELDRERVWALSDFLVQILNMPCLIGITEIEGSLHWVIDAHRLTTAASGI
jgi:hypothetical protein